MGSAVYKFFEISLLNKEKSQIKLIFTHVSRHLNDIKNPHLDVLSLYDLTSLWVLDDHFLPLYGAGENPPERLDKGKHEVRVDVKSGIFNRYSGIYAVFPLKGDNKYVYLSKSLDKLNEALFNIRKVILYIVLSTTVLIIILLNILLRSTITNPIKNIVSDINKIEKGEKVFLEGNYLREFKYLINNFNNLLKLTNIQRNELENKLKEVQQLNELLSKYHEEMSKFEKLISIGELSAGIAHEIGNPLNNIMGYLKLTKDEIIKYNNPELLDFIGRIEHEIERINQIVRSMLEYSRRESQPELVSTNLTALIDKTLDLAHLMIKNKDIFVNINLPDDPVYADIDPNRFQQVLLNILSNAIDGIEGRGKIEILLEVLDKISASERALLDLEFAGGEQPVGFIRLRVRDNGMGIDKRDLKHVFDPFFTTKEPGKGTGLGLSVSLQLIKEMKGSLSIESERGTGTVVTILLPRRVVS